MLVGGRLRGWGGLKLKTLQGNALKNRALIFLAYRGVSWFTLNFTGLSLCFASERYSEEIGTVYCSDTRGYTNIIGRFSDHVI